MAKYEGQGHLLSTKQTACTFMVCIHYNKDFYPKVTEIWPVSLVLQVYRAVCIMILRGPR